MQRIESFTDLVQYGTLFDWLFVSFIIGLPIYFFALVLVQHILG